MVKDPWRRAQWCATTFADFYTIPERKTVLFAGELTLPSTLVSSLITVFGKVVAMRFGELTFVRQPKFFWQIG